MLTRGSENKEKNNLISATRIGNTIKNDKIIDYLDLLDEKGLTVTNNLLITKKRSISDDFTNLNENNSQITKRKKTSFDYIAENGYIFESDIIKYIKQEMTKNNEIKKLIELNETNINLNCNLTIKTIKENKHTIILNSIIINKSNGTWGKPDLIVKGSWINKYIHDIISIDIDMNKWYIIDIKSSTINLINKGEDVSSKLLYSVYKSQIYIYTQALNYLMNEYGFKNDVKYGFILGKRYKYVLNNNQIIKNSFDCLGVIDFKKEKLNGIDWETTINNSIDWINDLRKNWKDFTLNPINKDELYPNMKNIYSKNWHKTKKQIAIINKEITITATNITKFKRKCLSSI